MTSRHLFLYLLLLLFPSLANAEEFSLGQGSSGSEFLRVDQAYQAKVSIEGDVLIIDWDIEPKYYLYKEKFKLFAQTSDSRQKLEAKYQKGLMHFDEYLAKETEIYYLYTRITVDISELPNRFELRHDSQGCADAGLCYAPYKLYFDVDRTTGTVSALTASAYKKKPTSEKSTPIDHSTDQKPGSLWWNLLLALGGGLILNLMPCVFPVLSLKALHFASHTDTPHNNHLHGWVYTLGVVGSFALASIFILAAKAAGEGAGWGFQLQYPSFVGAMIYLFLFMGLSLSGVVQFGSGLMGLGHNLTTQKGLSGSFFTGVLAAIVASPCTGPLMAPALGFALTQPAHIAMVVFVTLGFGMALPFLLISYFPGFVDLLPKPGVWMEKLKEALAFPMYITCAWLLFVFGRQQEMYATAMIVVGAIAIVFAIWLLQNQPKREKGKWMIRGLAALALGFSSYVVIYPDSFAKDESWRPYSKSLVEELRAEGRPVFVNFTADWCITCKYNERVAFSSEKFDRAVEKHDIALVKGDWTVKDENISAALLEFNRNGVPLYVLYPADSNKAPEILPQILSSERVLNAFEKASAK